MAESDLDYAKVTGRFGITAGDGDDTGDLPDIIWCDEGKVKITPLITYTKVADGNPGPWTGGHSVIVADIDTEGYLTYRGKPFVWVVDLTSDKVNPRITAGKATHRIEFLNVKADGTPVTFEPNTVRITQAGTDGAGSNDLTDLLPVPSGTATPIYRGEPGDPGVSVTDATISGGNLVLELSDGDTINAGELPVGPGGSNAGVAGYFAADGPTKTALAATLARLKAWAKNPDQLVAGAITYTSGLLSSAVVEWPDGLPGVLTITSRQASTSAVTAYTITRVDGATTTTYTQPTITRDVSGNATLVPQITVA